MALKDIKEDHRQFRSEYPRYTLERAELTTLNNGDTSVKAWYEFKPRQGTPTAYGRVLGSFPPEEKSAFYEWMRAIGAHKSRGRK